MKLKVPCVKVVPVIVPAEGFRTSPLGKLPEPIDQTIGASEFISPIVFIYGTPSVA
jgi:hypothetical protein